jgi:hypothetical protein
MRSVSRTVVLIAAALTVPFTALAQGAAQPDGYWRLTDRVWVEPPDTPTMRHPGYPVRLVFEGGSVTAYCRIPDPHKPSQSLLEEVHRWSWTPPPDILVPGEKIPMLIAVEVERPKPYGNAQFGGNFDAGFGIAQPKDFEQWRYGGDTVTQEGTRGNLQLGELGRLYGPGTYSKASYIIVPRKTAWQTPETMKQGVPRISFRAGGKYSFSFNTRYEYAWVQGTPPKDRSTAVSGAPVAPKAPPVDTGAAPHSPPVLGDWEDVGIGDCPGMDVGSTRSTRPEPSQCSATSKAHTAVCWDDGCTYKSIASKRCTGGQRPGRMYACRSNGGRDGAEGVPAGVSIGDWKPAGIGDCPGMDVGNTKQIYPEPERCSAGSQARTAVCWEDGCTYKSIATDRCTGGRRPGRMYACGTSSGTGEPTPRPADGASLAGRWTFADGAQTMVIQAEGGFDVYERHGYKINSGRWTLLDAEQRRYRFTHSLGGWVDTVTLSADGLSLDGTNNVGAAIHGSKQIQ